ncbi:MAG: PilZ domain-containing protein [Thermodesulfobacteriota bacterium]
MRTDQVELQVSRIYRPGIKVEVVYELDSDNPIVLPSLLYECQHPSMQLVIAQTNPEMAPGRQAGKMTLTALVSGELNRKFRAGIDCGLLECYPEYRLSSGNTARAARIRYDEDSLKVVNIRTAYRFSPNPVFRVDAEIRFDDLTFFSEQDFKIHNISFTGIGLLIPRLVGGKVNPMMELTVGQTLSIEIRLTDTRKEIQSAELSCELLVVRKEPDFNRRSGYAGFRLTGLSNPDVEKLNRFIHHAQLHEIRNGGGL